MEGRGRSRRRNPYRVMKERLSVLMAFILTVSIVLGNGGMGPGVAMAGQNLPEEEFRLHAEDIRTAAEDALQGEPMYDSLDITGSSEKQTREYEKLLAADGSLYELFPEYEKYNDLFGVELRVFLRTNYTESATPDNYELNGKEKLIFLYTNEGGEAVEVRLNIDGYVSDTNIVKPYDEAFGEEEDAADKLPADAKDPAAGKNEEMIPGEAPGNPAEGGAGSGTGSQVTPDGENTGSGETEAAPEEGTEPSEPETTEGETEVTEPSEPSEPETTEGETEATEASEPEPTEEATEATESSEPETTEGEAEVTESSEPETTEETTEGTAEVTELSEPEAQVQEEAGDAEASGDSEASAQITMSMKQVFRVASTLATPSEIATPSEPEKSEPEDSEPEDFEPSHPSEDEDLINGDGGEFKRVGKLKGKIYSLVSLDEYMTARAYAVSYREILGEDEETAESNHQITYTINPSDAAVLTDAPETADNEEDVIFGILPQGGYQISQVTANGEALEKVKEENTATPSDAEAPVYYVIPNVQEDQNVEIVLAEAINADYPAFYQEKTINGVVITVSAEEGVLPAGTQMKAEEVTEKVEAAVKEKVEGEASEESPVSVTSVLAYDITLYDEDGNMLDNSWSSNGTVKVEFSGERIEEKSKEADSVDVMHVETVEELIKEPITAEEVIALEKVSDTVNVAGEEKLSQVAFEAEHFSTYVVTFTAGRRAELKMTIHIMDSDTGEEIQSQKIGEGNIALTNNSISMTDLANRINGEVSSIIGNRSFEKATSGVAYDSQTVTSLDYLYGRWVFDAEWDLRVEDDDSIYFWYKKPAEPGVTFDPNGGTGAQVTRPLVEGKITMPEPTEIGIGAPEGHIFVGWSLDESGYLENYIAGIQPDDEEIKDGATLYAIWMDEDGDGKEHPAYFYIRINGEIQYEPAGYDQYAYYPFPGDPQLTGTLKDDVAVNNDLEKVKANLKDVPSDSEIVEALARYGMTYDPSTQEIVWYVIKMNGGVDAEKVDKWNVDGVIRDKTKYELKYDPNGGSINVPGSNEYASGEIVSIRYDRIPERAGYEFLGWDENKDASTPTYIQGKSPETIKMPDHDVTLYAIWKNKLSSFNGRKIWVDNNNVNKIRPDLGGVTLELTKTVNDNSETVEATPQWRQDITNPNIWTWEYVGLPEYEGDSPITYSIREIKVSDRYKMTKNGNDITNTLKLGSFSIQKKLDGINSPDEATYGTVKFQMFKSDADWTVGEAVGDAETVNAEGTVTFEDLFDGYYLISETSTVPGYQLCQDIKLQVVFENGKYIYKVNGETVSDGFEIINYPGVELPETGGSGKMMLDRSGWLLILLSLLGLNMQLINKRKRFDEE